LFIIEDDEPNGFGRWADGRPRISRLGHVGLDAKSPNCSEKEYSHYLRLLQSGMLKYELEKNIIDQGCLLDIYLCYGCHWRSHKELAQRNRKFRINPGEELNTVAITSITRIQQFTTMPENMKDGNYWFQKLRRPGTAHETLLMYLPLDGKLPYGKPLFQIVVTNYDMSFLWEGDLAT